MQQIWTHDDLMFHFTLSADEQAWLTQRTDYNQLGLAVRLKLFQYSGRFPRHKRSVPTDIVEHIASQLELSPALFETYDWSGRTAARDRQAILERLGFRQATVEDAEHLTVWLSEHPILYQDQRTELLVDVLYQRCRELRLEPPTPGRLERIARAAVRRHEQTFFATTADRLSGASRLVLDQLLRVDDELDTAHDEMTVLGWLKVDPGQTSVASLKATADRLRRLQAIELPPMLFGNTAHRVVEAYARRAATEPPRELRRRSAATRYTLMAAFCWQRRREITDQMVDLLMRIVHKINARAERRVETTLLETFRTNLDEKGLVVRLLQAAIDHPDGEIQQVLYPIASPSQMEVLMTQYQTTSRQSYDRQVHTTLRASYQFHYRQMLPVVLDVLTFRSKSQPTLIRAVDLLKRYLDSRRHTYPAEETVPIEGVIPARWEPLVIETNDDGEQRINRINYEMCVLTTLREHLRSKAVWVEGANAHRNPDEDLPADFEQLRDHYYAALGLAQDPDVFIARLQAAMHDALTTFDVELSSNDRVEVLANGHIRVARLRALPTAPTLRYLRAEVERQWPATSLLDVLKETDWRTDFSDQFQSAADHERLPPDALCHRLLLCLYGLGTNTGLRAMARGADGLSYDQLLYIRRRFIYKEGLRAANARVIDATRRIRQPHIWGESSTALAGDSRQFATYGQNLHTEWHVRYQRKGVKIYWHVDDKSLAIYSQVTRPSSSEVADMIEGIMRHHTEMQVERSYVDTHGQSEIGFAFCHLLGFDLMPRLKGIHHQRLYRPDTGQSAVYANLKPILTRPIRWDLIRQQYDAMVQYVTAVRLGTARTEDILRRFSYGSTQHPTYKAFLELGRAVKTIFLCRYLQSEALRREIHTGLNLVEHWHSATRFIFFGRQSILTSARRDDQVVSALSLHLLQNSLVYINTLMLQQVLAQPSWQQRMTDRDWQGLTPLFWGHINPYGEFRLDLDQRLPRLDGAA